MKLCVLLPALLLVGLCGCGGSLNELVCQAYDANGDGVVSITEARTALNQVYGEDVAGEFSDEEILQAFEQVYNCTVSM